NGRLFDAPYDYYSYYREQCVTARFGVIKYPVELFLNKVEGEPTETELRDIVQKHKGEEPDPTKSRPGFREPRKLKFDWIEVKQD
ncbi:hypothetical protein ACSTK9_23855, partial [Vibrio parahaemolyticus]